VKVGAKIRAARRRVGWWLYLLALRFDSTLEDLGPPVPDMNEVLERLRSEPLASMLAAYRRDVR